MSDIDTPLDAIHEAGARSLIGSWLSSADHDDDMWATLGTRHPLAERFHGEADGLRQASRMLGAMFGFGGCDDHDLYHRPDGTYACHRCPATTETIAHDLGRTG